MQLHCYNCEQKSLINNTSRSTSSPRCPSCRSEAVQFIQTRNMGHRSANQNLPSQGERLIRREYADPFQQMEQIFNRRNGMTRTRNTDFMSPMFPGLVDMERIKRMMQMPQFQQQQMTNMGRPTIFRQQIFTGPNQRVVIYSSNNEGGGEEEWEQLPQQLLPKKPKVQNYPVVTNLSQECSICNTKQNSGIQLPCGHKFHKQCLVPWFQLKDNCPCCRMKL